MLTEQSAEPPPTADFARRDYSTEPALRSQELGSAVRPFRVVVIDVLLEHALQMAPATNDQPVQALATGAPHPALGVGVGLRSLQMSADHLQAIASQHLLESERELLVVVADHKLGWGAALLEFPRKVSRLLADPLLVRVLGHPEPQDAPRRELHKEKDMEASEVPGFHREVARGQDRRGLSSQKRALTESESLR